MKGYIVLLACLSAVPPSLHAQTVDATVCDVVSNPQSFDGKIVRIKGTVVAGFDEFAIRDASCKQPVNAIWLDYPEGTKAKAGPLAMLELQLAKNSSGTASAPARTAVSLQKDKGFKDFDSFLSTPYQGNGMCLGCVKFTVTATLTGRLDGGKTTGITRDSAGKVTAVNGFGNGAYYPARLVLQSISDVASQEVDYSKAASIPKDDSGAATGGDPVAAAHQMAHAFDANTAPSQQLEAAAAAFGKPNEDNGVVVGFGVANEVRKDDDAKGSGSSPDGLLYQCTFAMDRMKGAGMTKAISHIGTHIADIRGTQPSATTSQAEFLAWHVTVLSAIALHQKMLTLPGGFVAWNATWAAAERTKMSEDAITSFLANWAGLGN
jgi:hypothetical protein